MANNWNIIVEKYDEMVGETGDIYHRKFLNPVVFKMLGNVKNKKILDLACGQGYFSRKLARRGARIVGVDLSDKLIEIAERIEKQKKQGIRYLALNSEKLDNIKSNTFDFVVSNISFHDIKNVAKVIMECGRVLKKNGKIIFTIPHPITDFSKKEEIDGKMANIMKVYMTEMTEPHQFSSRISVYHRSIGFYLNSLFGAGFLVSNFSEITTSLSGGKIISNKRLLKSKKEFPSFLIIEGIKQKN